jgi:hypothetical protein
MCSRSRFSKFRTSRPHAQTRAHDTVGGEEQYGLADFLNWGGSAVATLGGCLASAVEIATKQLPLVAPNLKIPFDLVACAAVFALHRILPGPSRRGRAGTATQHSGRRWQQQRDSDRDYQGSATSKTEFRHHTELQTLRIRFPRRSRSGNDEEAVAPQRQKAEANASERHSRSAPALASRQAGNSAPFSPA